MTARWQDSAACAGQTRLMYSDSAFGLARARQLCAGCPVLADCREHVLGLPHQEDGMWAGMSRKERQRVRRIRRELSMAAAS